jgi:hypothetical protein
VPRVLCGKSGPEHIASSMCTDFSSMHADGGSRDDTVEKIAQNMTINRVNEKKTLDIHV